MWTYCFTKHFIVQTPINPWWFDGENRLHVISDFHYYWWNMCAAHLTIQSRTINFQNILQEKPRPFNIRNADLINGFNSFNMWQTEARFKVRPNFEHNTGAVAFYVQCWIVPHLPQGTAYFISRCKGSVNRHHWIPNNGCFMVLFLCAFCGTSVKFDSRINF